MHSVDRSKLDPRAREAHWLGPDIDARAHRIFWPVSGTVSVERNVHFGTSAQLEKEEEDNVPGSEQNAAPPSPSACMLNHLPRCAVPPHVRKPSRTASDIQSGMGISSMHTSSTQSTTGTEMPGTLEETVKEAGGAWAVVNSMPELLEDFEGLEYVFAAETTDSEALEPRTLAEARCRPDWLLCEKTIQQELATLKAAGTWRLEDAPPGANIIGRKWVFKLQGQKGRHGERRAIQSATGCTRVQPDWGRRFDDTYLNGMLNEEERLESDVAATHGMKKALWLRSLLSSGLRPMPLPSSLTTRQQLLSPGTINTTCARRISMCATTSFVVSLSKAPCTSCTVRPMIWLQTCLQRLCL